RSDQINYEDFVGGSRVYTIAGVRVGTAEQKYDIGLQGEERVWRPPLTVLRTLIACWGDDAEVRSEEHTSELQSRFDLVCRLLLDSSTPHIYTFSLHDALPISL